jgi:hypothetical protein
MSGDGDVTWLAELLQQLTFPHGSASQDGKVFFNVPDVVGAQELPVTQYPVCAKTGNPNTLTHKHFNQQSQRSSQKVCLILIYVMVTNC